jgi:hyperosmotically inducible periplasmic protein
MFQRWQRMAMAALMIILPLAPETALGQQHSQAPAAKAKKKPAKPGAKTAKPAAKKASGSHPHLGPGAMMSHRPPMPPPRRSQFEVPQPKSVAETPDVVLNSRVRASLLSALTASQVQDIEPKTVKGVVTLTGSVKSREMRARAEQVARQVHGVRAVKNQLIVK